MAYIPVPDEVPFGGTWLDVRTWQGERFRVPRELAWGLANASFPDVILPFTVVLLCCN